jgi:tryptophan 6-halogenase
MIRRKIVVVGAGAAGYFAAAALKRNLPDVDVTVVHDPNTPSIGVGESLAWNSVTFMKNILGLTREFDWVIKSRSTVKLGTTHMGFDGTDKKHLFCFPMNVSADILYHKHYQSYNDFIHYDQTNSITKTSLLRVWEHCKENGLIDHESYSATAADTYWHIKHNTLPIDANGGWTLPPVTTYSHNINAPLVGRAIHDLVGKPSGVVEIASKIKEVVIGETGSIDHLVLDDDSSIHADLFIDCSGFARILAKRVDNQFVELDEYWNNSAIVGPHRYSDYSEHKNTSTLAAMTHGWRFSVPMDVRSGEGYIFNSRLYNKDIDELVAEHQTATGITDVNFRKISWTPGYYKDAFVKNCVLLGLSHGFSEPFDANGFSATLGHIMTLVGVLGKDDNFEFAWQKDYNRVVSEVSDNITFRINCAMHLAPKNDTQYWQEMKQAERKWNTKEKFLDAQADYKQGKHIRLSFRGFESTYGYGRHVFLNQGAYYGIPNIRVPHLNITPQTEQLAVNFFDYYQQRSNIKAQNSLPTSDFYKKFYKL